MNVITNNPNGWSKPIPEYYEVVQGELVPVYQERERLFNSGSLVKCRQMMEKPFLDAQGNYISVRIEQGQVGHIISRLPQTGLLKVHFPGKTQVIANLPDGRRVGYLGVYCQPQELEQVG